MERPRSPLFSAFIDVTRVYGRAVQDVSAAREALPTVQESDGTYAPLPEVFLLWCGSVAPAVIGVYRSRDLAEENLRLLSPSTPAWVDARKVG